MSAPSNALTALFLFILPCPLLLTGIMGPGNADRHVRFIKRWSMGATWFALGGATLASLTSLATIARSTAFFSLPLPWGFERLSLGATVNRLTLLMTLMVTLVGLVVSRYSATYMEGDAHEGAFHYWLSVTLGSFLTLVISGNLWQFFLFWVATSLFLHHLLAFYQDRPRAVLAARKKYVLHRIADLSLFVALVLIVHTLHITTFSSLTAALTKIGGSLPVSLQAASALILVSAVLKSAQVPFHGWLVQVIESPTPVSALMHAGIIYTGTFLWLRMVPLMSRVPWTGNLLIIIGLASISTAALMMMAASNIKASLAYSTVGQMGFMLMELGLGLYALALLHIVSHSMYKAHAFLSSGSVVDYLRWPAFPFSTAGATFGKMIGAWSLATMMTIMVAWILHIPLLGNLSNVVVSIILVVALANLFAQTLNNGKHTTAYGWMGIIFRALVVTTLYLLLNAWFITEFGRIFSGHPLARGTVHDLLIVAIIVTFMGLWILQQRLPQFLRHPLGQALYVHLYNDLYIDMFFDHWMRIVKPIKGSHSTLSRDGCESEKPLWEVK